MNERGSEQLPCGVELDPLIDQVAEGLAPDEPGHQAVCPHCQATLAELQGLWGYVRELAREEVVAPGRIIEEVIRRIREEFSVNGLLPLDVVVPRLVRHALLTDSRGTTRIADSVVAEIALRAARAVPGVHALGRGGARGALEALTPSASGVAVEVSGHKVTVELHVVVEYGAVIPAVVSAVRSTVMRSIETMTGLEVVEVNISVDDLYIEER